MSNSRVVGVVAAIVVLALVAFGVYHLRSKAPSPGAPSPTTEQSEKAPEAPSTESKSAESKLAEQKSAEAPEAKPEAKSAGTPAVPSFDIVRIEGSGEGVIAGRGAPGWGVKIDSDGATIAETTIDEEGAWTVILDKPLPKGKHKIGLKAQSPDGTSFLTAQQAVDVTVAGEAVAEKSSEQKVADESDQPQPVIPDESGESPKPPKPVRFEDVQYEDKSADAGKLKIAGTGGAGASILLYLDNQSLGQVTIGPDGTWSFEADTKLDNADHALRADVIQAGTGIVIGRTAAAFRRQQQAVASKQPEPVYPDGAPSGTPSPPPPTSMAAIAPPSVANQPQPSYPEGAPSVAASSAAAEAQQTEVASAPSPIEGQPKSVYPDGVPPAPSAQPSFPAVTAEAPSTGHQPQTVYPAQTAAAETPSVTAEAPGAGPTMRPEPNVIIKGADYRDTGAESGQVTLSGTSEPGARIQLFFDDAPIGEVTAGPDGSWSFEAEQRVDVGEHAFRADRTDAASGAVIGRASIGMGRLPKPAPKEEQVATEESDMSTPAAEPKEEQQVATAGQAVAEKPAQRRRSRVYTVRRGDTLWEIAESYFGGGWRYRAIVKQNKRQIKDPHWIYPEQQFRMPGG